MMQKLIPITALVLSLFATGCSSTRLEMKSSVDPRAGYTAKTPVFIDYQTDIPIEDRKYFLDSASILQSIGINSVPQLEAEYVVFLSFNRGLLFDASRDLPYVYSEQMRTEKYGILKCKLFKLKPDKKSYYDKSEWEGVVEIQDTGNTEEVRLSLSALFMHFTDSYSGVVRKDSISSQQVAGGDATR